jgi:hypothetical protein
MVNNFWSPVGFCTVSEIERVGGPAADDDYWVRRDGEPYLPVGAVQWILKSPDFEQLTMPRKPDPRAAHFGRAWPYHRG